MSLWILLGVAAATVSLVGFHLRPRTISSSLLALGSMSDRWLAEERAASASSTRWD